MRTICDSLFLFDHTNRVSPKLDEFAELVPEVVGEDHKAVVFSQWEGMVHEAAKVLDRLGVGYAVLHGGLPGKERREVMERFKSDAACKVFLSTDAGGMSYLRAIPAADIAEIAAAENDVEQAVAFIEQAAPGEQAGRRWPAYHPDDDAPAAAGHWPPVMLHYAINRPVGAQHGESDLAPLLRWLARYAGWLEDRARQRFKNERMCGSAHDSK